MFLIMNLKSFFVFGLIFFIFNICSALSQNDNYRIKIVCIDAGHGGKDPGTVHKNIYEKNITLNVAKKLGFLINKNFRDVEVVYTRSKDVAVPLYKRAQIANSCKADLFISIHVNAVNNSRVFGTESYALGIHKTNENLKVAMKENAVIKYEDDYATKYEGFDPSRPESYIMFNMLQSQHLEQSLKFADYIEQSFFKSGRKSRDVRQAGFLVLTKASMPAVLVELGFITNPSEVIFLKSKSGQDKLAKSLFMAFRRYKLGVERKYNIVKKRQCVMPDGISFMIQIASSSKKMKISNFKLNNIGEVKELFLNGSYKYMIGEVADFNKALLLLKRVRYVVKDSFIVAFNNGKRISVSEARKISE